MVAVADTARVDLHNGVPAPRRQRRDLLHRQRLVDPGPNRRAHPAPPPSLARPGPRYVSRNRLASGRPAVLRLELVPTVPTAVLLDFYGTLAHATAWVSIDVVLAEHGYELADEVRERWWFESEHDGIEHVEHSQRPRRTTPRGSASGSSRCSPRPTCTPASTSSSSRSCGPARRPGSLERYDESVEVLRELRDRGPARSRSARTGTGTSPRPSTRSASTGLVDVVVSSAWAGARKPHPLHLRAHPRQDRRRARPRRCSSATPGGPTSSARASVGMTPLYLQRDGHWPDPTAPADPAARGRVRVRPAGPVRPAVTKASAPMDTTTGSTGTPTPTHSGLDAAASSGGCARPSTRDAPARSSGVATSCSGCGRCCSEREAELLDALAADLGKPAIEAYAADVGFVYARPRPHALKHLGTWTRPQTRADARSIVQPAQARIVREPLGVVLIIAPWNYPVQLVLAPLVGAIAAGNCAVLKPSEVAPHTSEALARSSPEYLDPECIASSRAASTRPRRCSPSASTTSSTRATARVGRVVMEAAAQAPHAGHARARRQEPRHRRRRRRTSTSRRGASRGASSSTRARPASRPTTSLVARSVEAELVDRIGRAVTEFYGDDPQDEPRLRAHRQRPPLRAARRAARGRRRSRSAASTTTPTALHRADGAPRRRARRAGHAGGDLRADPAGPPGRRRRRGDRVRQRDATSRSRSTSSRGDSRRRTTRARAHVIAAARASTRPCSTSPYPRLPFGGVGASGMGAYHGRAELRDVQPREERADAFDRVDPKLAYPPYTSRKERHDPPLPVRPPYASSADDADVLGLVALATGPDLELDTACPSASVRRPSIRSRLWCTNTSGSPSRAMKP